jgi:hypothetical protein
MRRLAAIGVLSVLMMAGFGTSPGMAEPRAHVYVLRGLMNIFSLGMDTLAEKIQRHGINATVHNYSEWQSLADHAAAAYHAGTEGPIIIIGHSLGGDAVMQMSAYDSTQSFPTPSNVGHLLNLTHADYGRMWRGTGFRGTLSNIDVSSDHSIDHLNIDKSARLHTQVLAAVLAAVGGSHHSAPTANERHKPGSMAAPESGSDGASKPADSTPAPAKPADGASGSIETVKPLADGSTPVIAIPKRSRSADTTSSTR